MPQFFEGKLDAAGLRFGIVIARFNSFIGERLLEGAVDALMPASGAGGLSAEGPLQRQFRDIHAASAHIALTWDIHGAAYGQSALGLPSPAGFLL